MLHASSLRIDNKIDPRRQYIYKKGFRIILKGSWVCTCLCILHYLSLLSFCAGHDYMNQFQVMMQSCAFTAHGGPRYLTFAPRRPENLSFFDTNHMPHTVAFTGSELWASFNFLRAQPQPTFYLISNISGASNFAGFLPFYDNIFGSFFPGLIPAPRKSFPGLNWLLEYSIHRFF